jgi:hypothetical protein
MDRHLRDQCGHAIGFRVEGGASLADHRLAGSQERHCLPAPGQPRHARIINEQVAAILGQGKHVAVFPGRNDDRWLQLAAFSCRVVATGAGGRAAGVAGGNFLWELDGQRSLAPRYDGDISLGNARAHTRTQAPDCPPGNDTLAWLEW